MSDQDDERVNYIEEYGERPYREEEFLISLYIDQELSMTEIGKRVGRDGGTIQYWLKKHGIERRSREEAQQLRRLRGTDVGFYTRTDGYEEISTTHDREYERFLHHRLIAVAEYGYEAVVDNHVHHALEIPWANWREVLDVVSPAEHREKHARKSRERGEADTFQEESLLRELYWDDGLTTDEISHEVGCSRDMVEYWMRHHGIETRAPTGDEDYHDPEVLRQLYYNEEMTLTEIGEMFNRSDETIRRHMKENNIPRRTGGGCE